MERILHHHISHSMRTCLVNLAAMLKRAPLAPDFNVEVLCGSLPPVQDCFHPVDASILKSGGRGEKESRHRSGTREGVRKIVLNRCKIDSINRTGAPHIVYMKLKFRCPKSMNAFQQTVTCFLKLSNVLCHPYRSPFPSPPPPSSSSCWPLRPSSPSWLRITIENS